MRGRRQRRPRRQLGLLTTTVAGQKWSENAAEMLADRDLFVLEDNDEPGRFNTEKALELLAPVASRSESSGFLD